jgi:hypothetical protein
MQPTEPSEAAAVRQPAHNQRQLQTSVWGLGFRATHFVLLCDPSIRIRAGCRFQLGFGGIIGPRRTLSHALTAVLRVVYVCVCVRECAQGTTSEQGKEINIREGRNRLEQEPRGPRKREQGNNLRRHNSSAYSPLCSSDCRSRYRRSKHGDTGNVWETDRRWPNPSIRSLMASNLWQCCPGLLGLS